MDGVLTNFRRAVAEAFNKPYSYETESSNWFFWEDWGITTEEVENICTTDFWQFMPFMHDALSLFGTICVKFNAKQIYLLSEPMSNVESMTGKWLWIKHNLPSYYKRTILMKSPKHLLAKPNTLLIDDRDSNIEKFQAAGGHGILVPRIGNKLGVFADLTVEIVSLQLRKYQSQTV